MTRISMIAAALALGLPAAASAGNVAVDLTGLRAGGTVYVQLQTRDQFLGAERVTGKLVPNPQAGALRVDLGEVPPGDYAIMVWHDSNDNRRMEIDPSQGAAPDGWAMPNGDAIRSRPDFEQARVSVPAAGLSLPLELRYGF